MLQALLRTILELLDSKKATYSFLAAAIAIVLHLKFGVSIEDAILLVSPLGLATVAQAHVDAQLASNKTERPPAAPAAPTAPPVIGS
jgi:hypothetical protein